MARRRRGRPKMEDDEKAKPIPVALRPELRERIDRYAGEAGLRVAPAIRELVSMALSLTAEEMELVSAFRDARAANQRLQRIAEASKPVVEG